MRKSRVPTRSKIQSIVIKHSRIRTNGHNRIDDRSRIVKMQRRISNVDSDAGSNNRVGSDDLNGTAVLAGYEQE